MADIEVQTATIEFTEKELSFIQTLLLKQHLVFGTTTPTEFGDTQELSQKVLSALTKIQQSKVKSWVDLMFWWVPKG